MSQPLHQRTDALLRRLLRKRAAAGVRKILARTRPEDVAAAMGVMTAAERRRLFDHIDDIEFQADVLAGMADDLIEETTRDMTEEHVVQLLDRMDPDDATDVVEVLPDELRARVIDELSGVEDAEVSALLAWPSDSAGGIMSPKMFKMPETATCGEAIESLQATHEDFETVFYVYVVDTRDRLVGVVSLRSLLVHPPRTPLVSIMESEVIAVSPREDQEEVARYVARYDLLAVPVVDEERRLLGIVTVDDVVDVIREEAVEDMFMMAGVHEGPVDATRGGPFTMARMRAGWLLATAFGGLMADQVVHLFEGTVPLEVLAGLIPVVMGMGGNVGIQSTTIAVRGLATGAVQLAGAATFVWRETQVGLLLGLTYGLLIGGYGLLTGWPETFVGLSVGASVFAAILLGSTLGAGLPVLLQRLNVDPAVATGPLVTTGIDILGIFIYLNVARLLLGL